MLDARDKGAKGREKLRKKIQFERIGWRGRRSDGKNNEQFKSKRIFMFSKQCDGKGNGINSLIFPDQTKSSLSRLLFILQQINSNKASQPQGTIKWSFFINSNAKIVEVTN